MQHVKHSKEGFMKLTLTEIERNRLETHDVYSDHAVTCPRTFDSFLSFPEQDREFR